VCECRITIRTSHLNRLMHEGGTVAAEQ
jgi:hypothetical protein